MKRNLTALLAVLIMILSVGNTAAAAENEWNILSGFGSVKATGTGTSKEEDGGLTFNGYGGLSYTPRAVHDAVAIQFQIQAYPSSNHYFYFGLMDTKSEPWNNAGSKAQGLISEIVVAGSGKLVKLVAMSKSESGTITINTDASELKALGICHMLVMYKEADNWTYVLDGVTVAKVPASSVKIGESSDLVAGAFGSSTMEMTINNVYIDEEVTGEMKDGSYIKELAGADGQINVYYDDNDKLVMGDATKSSVLSYEEPGYVVSEMKTEGRDNRWLTIMIGCGAAVTFAASIVMFCIENRRKKKTCRGEEN